MFFKDYICLFEKGRERAQGVEGGGAEVERETDSLSRDPNARLSSRMLRL